MVLNELGDLHHCIFLYGREGVQSYHLHHLSWFSRVQGWSSVSRSPTDFLFDLIPLCISLHTLFSVYAKLSPGYSNCWVKILLSQCQPFLVSAEEYAVVKHRSNSQLEPRDAKLSELSCSCLLFLTDIERVLTSPLDFLACNIQSWAELWWTEFHISSQNIKQINPTQHSMIPFQLLPWGINVSNGKLTWAHQHGREMMATPPWLSLKEDLFWREYEGEKGDCLLKTFQVSELQVSYSHLCAQEDHRTDCLGNYTKAHEK